MAKINKNTNMSIAEAQEFVNKPENKKRFSEYQTRLDKNKQERDAILTDFADVKAIFAQVKGSQNGSVFHARKTLEKIGLSAEEINKILAKKADK